MTNTLIPALVVGGLTGIGTLLAQLSGQTTIPIELAAGSILFSAGLVAWLSRKLQKIEDDIEHIKSDLAKWPCPPKDSCPL